jgi:hypothetical protein
VSEKAGASRVWSHIGHTARVPWRGSQISRFAGLFMPATPPLNRGPHRPRLYAPIPTAKPLICRCFHWTPRLNRWPHLVRMVPTEPRLGPSKSPAFAGLLSGRTVQVGFAMQFLGILQTSCKRRTAIRPPSARFRPDVCHSERVCAIVRQPGLLVRGVAGRVLASLGKQWSSGDGLALPLVVPCASVTSSQVALA